MSHCHVPTRYDVLRPAPGKLAPPVIAQDPDADGGGHGRVHLVCRACGHRITTPKARTVIHGRHRHAFFNPHGHVFDIGCFSQAPGCKGVGDPSPEFTWFPGYVWQIVLCGSCEMHLGWHYSTGDGGGFFGLILDHLVEELDGEG